MTTTTPNPTYVALTDAGTKHWHLGAIERAEVCYCGTRLMTPTDTRKFALKVPAAERNYQTDTQLDCIDCGACKRNREYRYATGLETRPATTTPTRRRTRRAAPAPVPAPETPTAAAEARMGESELASHTRRRRPQHAATVTPAEAAALAEAAATTPEAADHAAPPSRRRRPSKADRAHAAAERDRERREALAASTDATLAAIEGAVAEATGEAPLTASLQAAVDRAAPAWNTAVRGWKADALVSSGLATSRADARAQLADMGE